ncbi:Bel1-like homeodomain protein [Thalictrum thalictroides]|uniref:Bel1-like homeodomain protein n=1 Tax=Thalictrum thalictroides TaxID=46969 RepID=A0A7J6X3N0_THATH|nr:Bel1-like homeodomain protein [Thalictrum thalictroides]
MATYYSSSSDQDVMPENCPRDLLQAPYPEGQVISSNMMMYLNQSTPAASYSDGVPGDYQQHNCSELPATGASHSNPSRQGNLSDLIGSDIREAPYDLWRDGANEMSFMQPMSDSVNTQSISKQIDSRNNLVHSSVTDDSQMGLSPQMDILHRGPNLPGQGLSLSLSTQIPTAVPMSFLHNRSNLGPSSFFNSYTSNAGDGSSGASSCRDDVIAHSGQSGHNGYFQHHFLRENHNVVKGETGLNYLPSNKLSGLSSFIPNSKYLKVAQQLLDEIVDVRKAPQQESDKQQSSRFGLKIPKDNDGPKEDCELSPRTRKVQNDEESNTKAAGEHSPASSQDLQNKVTELLSMLDEVDRRYKHYYHQMQIVASYFDGIAGSGASKPYTTLALQTISRHFRCIRDAISHQIKEIRSSLGEEDTVGSTKEGGISRLRFVEQKLRQHRALQQLGMMQQHAWRPQRGLPETSVTILRAWLFEHFLHPYPKDSDKITLAKQTGLTRGQVSNWFINARVRLWKPMIEDMYKEEIGDSEMEFNCSSDNTPIPESHNTVSEDMGVTSLKNVNSAQSKTNLTCDAKMSGHTSGNCFQGEGHDDINPHYVGMNLIGEQRSNTTHSSLSQNKLFQSDENADGRFMAASNAYQLAELEMFGSQGGISLTLGLQHFDGAISDTAHQNFVTMPGDDMYNVGTSSMEPNNADTNCMDPDNHQQYRFGTSHLFHDFVA